MQSLGDHFIVCGLGSLGRCCLQDLRRYETPDLHLEITAIELRQLAPLDHQELRDLLDGAILRADCREEGALVDAGIDTARAILLVTNDESVNIQAAVAARRLNAGVRLVVRLSKPNLAELLEQQLGNFVAFNPSELPAQAFALAAWHSNLVGSIEFDDCEIRVLQQIVKKNDDPMILGLNTAPKNGKRVIAWHPQSQELQAGDDNGGVGSSPRAFFDWEAEHPVKPGDHVATLQVFEKSTLVREAKQAKRAQKRSKGRRSAKQMMSNSWLQLTRVFEWVSETRSRLFVVVGLLVAFLLWGTATIVFKTQIDGLSWARAMTSAVLLLIGGYGDLLGGFEDGDSVPVWVHVTSLFITAISFLYVLSAFGVLAESVLNTRLSVLGRQKLPNSGHVVLIGMKRLGNRVGSLLARYQQRIVVVVEDEMEIESEKRFPTFCGDPVGYIDRLHLENAKSLVVLTDHELMNLEIALAARDHVSRKGGDLELVVRTFDHEFGRNLVDLVPDAKVIVAHELSAEAFAAAAFGEKVLSVFRLDGNTVLVTEYRIEEGDHLHGLLLSDIAYGYGTVPVLWSRGEKKQYLPDDDIQIEVGDKLVLLATTNGLRRVEHGKISPRTDYQIQIESVLIDDNRFSAGNDLARITGCSLETARTIMNELPTTVVLPLYPQQVESLRSVLARQISFNVSSSARSVQSNVRNRRTFD
ncbi:MAG: NAD-binding protein [Planctomycetota bacterium]